MYYLCCNLGKLFCLKCTGQRTVLACSNIISENCVSTYTFLYLFTKLKVLHIYHLMQTTLTTLMFLLILFCLDLVNYQFKMQIQT